MMKWLRSQVILKAVGGTKERIDSKDKKSGFLWIFDVLSCEWTFFFFLITDRFEPLGKRHREMCLASV